MPQPLIVTAALISHENKILITRRPEGSRDAGKWEFPGGKLEENETPEECLRRELLEELNLPARVESIFQVLHHRYSWGAILLLVFECTALSENIDNREVAEHRFVSAGELQNFDFLEADRPIITRLIEEAESTSDSIVAPSTNGRYQ